MTVVWNSCLLWRYACRAFKLYLSVGGDYAILQADKSGFTFTTVIREALIEV